MAASPPAHKAPIRNRMRRWTIPAQTSRPETQRVGRSGQTRESDTWSPPMASVVPGSLLSYPFRGAIPGGPQAKTAACSRHARRRDEEFRKII